MVSSKTIARSVFILYCFVLVSCDKQNDTLLASSISNEAKDELAILQLYENWTAAVENGDRQKYVNLLDENVVLVAPGAADIVGRKDYATFLSPVFENATYKIEPIRAFDIELLGDVALVRYDYLVHVTMKDGVNTITDSEAALTKLTNKSKYLDVLKRQASGEWRVFRHMWNEGSIND